MDILTQGLLGATLAQSVARQRDMRVAAGVGFAAGLLADADVLIRSEHDPLLALEYHRHFTHSVFFIPFGALLAALVLWPFLRNRLAFGRLYLYALLGYSLSGFLDACTSYGTQLFWPLLQERVSFYIISIVDPVFSLVLLLAAGLALKRRSTFAARAGLVLAGCYLLFGLWQHQRAQAVVEQMAVELGHTLERRVVKPTLGNLVLWRSVYQSDDTLYVDAVRVGLVAAPRVYRGGSVKRVVPERDFSDLSADSVLYRDIVRFTRFSDGFVALHPKHRDVLADIRYAILPTAIEPLWGIEMDRARPQQHARYVLYRDLSGAKRELFWSMLRNDAAID